MFKQRFAICLVLSIGLLTAGVSITPPSLAQDASAPATNAQGSVFVENVGQWPDAARFQVWGSPLGAGTTWLAKDAIWLVVASGKSPVARPATSSDPVYDLQPATLQPATLHAIRLTFPGSNPDARIEPFDPLTTTVSYFIGNDPAQWRPAVPVWSGVRYVDLYPGVDLVIGDRDDGWRLQAAPGAAPDQVQMLVEGAEVLGIVDQVLHLDSSGEQFSISLPATRFPYQVSEVSRDARSPALTVQPGTRAYHPVNSANDLVNLFYSTFLGGGDHDSGQEVVVDHTGSAFVVGSTLSGDFPTTPGAFSIYHDDGYDAFVVKLNPAGNGLSYATFLGGNNDETGHAIAVDGRGNAYVTGVTGSTDFPVTAGAFDTSYGGNQDVFVAKLSPLGSQLTYATFIGGANHEQGNAIAVDEMDSAYLTGQTLSSAFPSTPGAFDTSYNGEFDAFVVKLNSAGSGLIYATFLGGSDRDLGSDIVVDSTGSASVMGFYTQSDDFPTTHDAFDGSYNGSADAFVAKLDPFGSELVYATFLGGSSSDRGTGIATDGTDSTYVTGYTTSDDFPTTPGAYDTSHNGVADVFVVKLVLDSRGLIFATLLGGKDYDYSGAIAVDSSGSAYVVGHTTSDDFPTVPGAFDTSYNGGGDAFVAKLNPLGSTLTYATFLGGNEYDLGSAIVVDAAGRATLTGYTASTDFPTTPNAFDTSHNGGHEAFVSKLNTVPYIPNVTAPVEQPPSGALVAEITTLRGFAIDRGSSTGTGIDTVHIYLDGPYGTGTIIGGATYGLDRPDVAAQYGARFGPSGWELVWDTSGVAPGIHHLYLYAHRTSDNAWTLTPSHWVFVARSHATWLPMITRR